MKMWQEESFMSILWFYNLPTSTFFRPGFVRLATLQLLSNVTGILVPGITTGVFSQHTTRRKITWYKIFLSLFCLQY